MRMIPMKFLLPTTIFMDRCPRRSSLICRRRSLAGSTIPAEQRKSLAAAYDNALNYTDSQMGELLRFLERSPEWRNTYVIITADHGEAFGEHHSYSHGWDLYREVLHVPLAVVGPGIPRGVRDTGTARTRQILRPRWNSPGPREPHCTNRA